MEKKNKGRIGNLANPHNNDLWEENTKLKTKNIFENSKSPREGNKKKTKYKTGK